MATFPTMADLLRLEPPEPEPAPPPPPPPPDPEWSDAEIIAAVRGAHYWYFDTGGPWAGLECRVSELEAIASKPMGVTAKERLQTLADEAGEGLYFNGGGWSMDTYKTLRFYGRQAPLPCVDEPNLYEGPALTRRPVKRSWWRRLLCLSS